MPRRLPCTGRVARRRTTGARQGGEGTNTMVQAEDDDE
jgi:hypothetical protein